MPSLGATEGSMIVTLVVSAFQGKALEVNSTMLF